MAHKQVSPNTENAQPQAPHNDVPAPAHTGSDAAPATPDDAHSPKKHRGAAGIIARVLLWFIVGLIGLAVLIPVLIYIPFIQDIIVPIAIEKINEGGDMKLSVDRLRLRFPLDFTVDSLDLRTKDMTVTTAHAEVSVSLPPLLKGDIKASEISARGGYVTIGRPDTSMYMTVAMQQARLRDASIALKAQEINVESIEGRGARVRMWMKPDSVPPPDKETSDSTPVNWHICLESAELADIDYAMQLEPIINDLGATVRNASIRRAEVDMRYNKVAVGDVEIDSVDARYIYYPPEYVENYPVKAYVAPDTLPTLPWTVTADKLRLNNGAALYALKGHTPPTGAFDPEYIRATEITVAVDSFLNRGTKVYAPVSEIAARERCGVPLKASGLFDMDSVRMRVDDFLITTPSSHIRLTGSMAMAPEGSAMSIMDTPVSLRLNAGISHEDMARLVPFPMNSMVAQLPPYAPLNADIDIEGKASGRVTVSRLAVALPGYVELSGKGFIENLPAGIDHMKAHVDLSGNMRNGNFIKPMLLDAKMGREINFPPLTLDGSIDIDRGNFGGDLSATTPGGDIAMTASWDGREEGYSLDLNANTFPVQSIMPGLGIRDVDASVVLDGHGLDPFRKGTVLRADIDLRSMVYNGVRFHDATLKASINEGFADLNASLAHPDANLTVTASGNLLGDTLSWDFDGDVRKLDLMALKLSPTESEGNITLHGHADIATDGSYDLLAPIMAPPATALTKGKRTVKTKKRGQNQANILDRISQISASLDIEDFYWRLPAQSLNGRNVLLDFLAGPKATDLNLTNNDLKVTFGSPAPVGELATSFGETGRILQHIFETRKACIDTLSDALPPFSFDINAGPENILASFLLDHNMTYQAIKFSANNDSILNATGEVTELKTGETTLDSIALDIHQAGKHLLYEINVNNRPGTLDNFAHIQLSGFLGPENFALVGKQQNIEGETGFSFGSVIYMPDPETFALRFVPFHPVIGYKDWTVNRDNLLTYNYKTGRIDANLNLHSDKSTIEILTEHNEADSTGQALIVHLKDIHLSEWLALNPFAPPVKGQLSADVRLGKASDGYNGKGTIQLADFMYDRQKVGDFDIDFDAHTRRGALIANAAMMVNGRQALTLSGTLNDTTAVTPFNLDMKVIHFPLSVANPFLGAGTATLTGTLNGTMDVTGRATEPVLNGWLEFDSAAVVPTVLGTRFAFEEKRIPVVNNRLTLDNFNITALNDNPLTINGWVDINDMTDIKMDIDMKASNMQIVGGKRIKSADVYGKAFVDLTARAKGSTSFLDVNANLTLLSGSNVTYVIPTLTQTIAAQSDRNMVKFINFTDSTAVSDADSLARPSMLMNIDAQLTVQNGTTVAVDLSADGKDKVQLQANGTINYSSDFLNDQHVTGRINLNSGFARYTPPFMSEKNFTFEEGSYVAFTGDMMNPQLNIRAVDNIKANVQEQGASARQVNFAIQLAVTGTLNAMNVAFDLSTDDDLTVENELKSMSPEQRANSAMNLLVTGMYTGPGTKAAVGSNPLFSLLESQLNSLAAKTIKGVDLSFGIDQLNREGASSAMSYSYKVSKSLFDDRFKIVVGGNYTTDENADENFAENLIADISFEYMLNKQGTMYVKIFRHTGYESIIEGEVTETGVGFVYKKRLRHLRDLFRRGRSRKSNADAQETETQATTAPADGNVPAEPTAPVHETGAPAKEPEPSNQNL